MLEPTLKTGLSACLHMFARHLSVDVATGSPEAVNLQGRTLPLIFNVSTLQWCLLHPFEVADAGKELRGFLPIADTTHRSGRS